MEDLLEPLKVGDYVHYIPNHGPKENGRIKFMGQEYASVVYKCNGEWDKYEEYTGARTELNHLSRGWIDGDEPKEKQPYHPTTQLAKHKKSVGSGYYRDMDGCRARVAISFEMVQRSIQGPS